MTAEVSATAYTEMSEFADTVMRSKYLKDNEDSWEDISKRVAHAIMDNYFPELTDKVQKAIFERKFLPGGRYLANAGTEMSQFNNCFLYRVEDTKESIADTYRKITVTGMMGGGVGILWSDLRPRGASVNSNGGASTGPCSFMQTVNEIGRGVINGGSRRMAIIALLHWWHPDVFEFMSLKDWDENIQKAKEENFSAYAPMDMTNISVTLDDDFFEAINNPEWSKTYTWEGHSFTATSAWAKKVYDTAITKMLEGGEPGFSVDRGENSGEVLRNPCGEITSSDDSDVCCLGSINISRVESLEEFKELVEISTAFLLCGTLESIVPHDEVLYTREKNRRLGLGIMGIHDWLIQRDYKYEENEELASWLREYAKSTEISHIFADRLSISRPVKTRAIAPTGSIGILAETTTGIEPIFAMAYKRRYLKEGTWHYQYVVDGAAKRLEDSGIDPDSVETASDLADDPERRVAFQAFVQRYVDHAISSTLNLPAKELQSFSADEFSRVLMKYLPDLRGVTVYPDGSRSGQPLNVVSYAEAKDWVGYEYQEVGLDQSCINGVCGV